MSEIEEFLVGESKVRVETTEGDYEFPIKDEDTIETQMKTPQYVVEYLRNQGYEINLEFESQIYTDYVHDEKIQPEIKRISKELNLDEDHVIIQAIANQTYEISLEYHIQDEKTCLLTAVNGHEIKNPPNII